ncbi:uncharacterized protein KY384_008353 [Bacidia gigantensis]|uniref:uncharacterized protein n=1 Tax=Bacidia gigantensis TaxID=2732470 RepID=UPI001D038D25|nr:uncharacterized protein KY384_008353 [Bacidia gigantensis]KAG8526924.1 hypothetical protein KY384_008353 [Bacidia gigantensis]
MASLQDNQFFSKRRERGLVVVDEPPKLDLDAYISNYKGLCSPYSRTASQLLKSNLGRTRYERLYLIGVSSTYLCLDALKAAIKEVKKNTDETRKGVDVSQYEQAVATLYGIVPSDPDAILDTAWVERMKKVSKAETDKMEVELKGYKNNLIKESIRMGYQDLGKQYQYIGDLANATKSFSKMYDYMTANGHVVSMCMYLIQVAIDQRNWTAVTMNAQRIWSNGTTKYEEAKKQSAKLSSALGLAELAGSNYKNAADLFLDTDPRMTQAKLDNFVDEEAYNEVLTPNDVATYGGLCALASFSRSELQTKVLEHKTFRNYLELEPHLRRAITFFIASKYAACLSILEAWKSDYLLDLYLQNHYINLVERVRRKAIQQYFIPFSCVTLKALSEAFNTDEATIEVELMQMIKRGELEARIDLVDRLLLANKVDKRAEVHERALKTAKDYERTAHLRILRMAIVNAGLEVKPPKDKGVSNVQGISSQGDGMFGGAGAGDLIGGVPLGR